jgi:hypothetical protein
MIDLDEKRCIRIEVETTDFDVKDTEKIAAALTSTTTASALTAYKQVKEELLSVKEQYEVKKPDLATFGGDD